MRARPSPRGGDTDHGPPEVTALIVVGAVASFAVLFVGWAWAMNRMDAREERRHFDELRQDGRSPSPGGPPRHATRRRADDQPGPSSGWGSTSSNQ